MATKEAWNDRKRLLGLFDGLKSRLHGFVVYAEELNKFKDEVLDDVDRKAELKKIIDEDPDWTLTQIQDKYLEFKAIYDYLMAIN